MDRLIFTAVSGMQTSITRERVIASNMANAQTAGFREETIDSTPVTLDGPQLQVRAMNRTQVHGANMKAGPVNRTGRDLDIALLDDDTLLAVQAPDGSEAYTRRGDLSVSATGVLQNGDGLPVIGDGGPVSVPLGQAITIAPDGSVLAADPATPGAVPAQVAKLKLASRAGTQVQKDLTGLFRVVGAGSGGGVLPADENATLEAGSLEQSNVNPTQVLVDMLQSQRLFEIRSKLVSTARELDESGASLMRINS